MLVAVDATEELKIARAGVAIDTLIPFILMLAAVDREILLVMVKSGRIPGCFGMTILTGCREPCGRVVRVGCRIVIAHVAAVAGVRRGVVVAVVAGCTVIGDSRMCPVQRIIVVVNRERSRRPAGCGRVTHDTIRRKIQRHVVRVGRLVEIWCVTSRTLRGRTGISSGVTFNTICGKVRAG